MDDLKRFKANAAFFPGDKVTWYDKEGALRWDPEGIWRIGATLLKKLESRM
jgi:hypothetical protein